MFKIFDVVRIKNLLEPEDEWNGYLALVIGEEYIHQKAQKKVIKIKIGDSLWAIEVGNIEKITDDERLQYFRTYEGNQICEWSSCWWKPKTLMGKGPQI